MAYNRYQYETSPRKLQTEYEPRVKKYPKKSTAKKQQNRKEKIKQTEKITKAKIQPKINAKTKINVKPKMKSEAKVIIYVAIGFIILFAISYRNSLINERFSEIKELKANLAQVEKKNEQLEVNIENNLNLKTIEQSAKELLGMQKLETSQTVYVNLPKQDYVEPASEEIIEEQEISLWEKIVNFITGK